MPAWRSEKLEKATPTLVSGPGIPLEAVVAALGAPAVVVKGEVEVDNGIIRRNGDHNTLY